MFNLGRLFGRSPFEPLVQHARKVHQCVGLIRPVADAVIARDAERLAELQHEMSRTEHEADQLKDTVRQNLPQRYFLPVNRGDMARYLTAMDKIADGAEDFAVAATLGELTMSDGLQADFLALVEKVLQLSESLLGVAEHVGQLQKETFIGPEADNVLQKIQEVCHMEWETDKLGRKLARRYYADLRDDPVSIMLLEKLSLALGRIADYAENVGKSLRLMIKRK